MQTAGKLQIYNASAGSGKTYTLTRNYLRLAFAAPDAYRKILAVTFTNKATEEMKTRILKSLHQLKEGLPNDFIQVLMDEHHLDENRLKQRASIILSDILQNYSYFSIFTIDTFFQKILRSFTREMNLGSGYEVELDTQLVMDEVVTETIASISADPYLESWLTQMAVNKIENSGSWNITDDLKSQGMEIFNESFMRMNFHKITDDDLILHLAELNREVNQIITQFKKDIIQESDKALEIMRTQGLQPDEFSGKSRSFAFQFVKWSAGNTDYPTNTFLGIADNPEKWYSKTADEEVIRRIDAAYQAGMNESVRQLSSLFQNEYRRFATAVAIHRNIYVFGIYRHLLSELQRYREEHNVLLLSDANLFLRELVGEDETSFLYEKIGSRFQHYLIDEFQDTSGFQWENFKPLLKDATDQGFESMIVGDVKQSIYRWRGGRREILLEEAAIAFQNSELFQLDTNWRSARNIVTFNNFLYGELPTRVFAKFAEGNTEISESIRQSIDQITAAFKEGTQKWNGKSEGGYVNVTYYTEAGEEEQSRFETALVERIKNIQDRGISAGDICVLVRSKLEAAGIAEIFSTRDEEGYNFRFISSESGFLTGSASVRFILCTLRWLDNANHELNNAEMLKIYHEHIAPKSPDDWHQLLEKAKDKTEFLALFPSEFTAQIESLKRQTPFRMVEQIIDIFELNQKPEEISYLMAFQDFVLENQPSVQNNLSLLLREWDERGLNTGLKLTGKVDAIKILTIHKAKGLEFDVVVIPFLDGIALDGRHSSNFWAKTSDSDFRQFDYLPLQYLSGLADSQFSEEYYREKFSYYVDHLNLLYVATTRAVSELHIFANKKRYGGTGMAAPVLSLLEKSNQYEDWKEFANSWNPEQEEFCFGTPAQHFVESKGDTELNYQDNYTITPAEKLPQLKGIYHKKYADANTRYGELIHYIFSKIKTADNVDFALHEAFRNNHISAEESQTLKIKIQQLLSDDMVGSWFKPHWKVRTERKLITAQGVVKIPDRVIYHQNKAIVIDFKTGIHRPENEKQVQTYVNLMIESGFEQVEGWLLYTDEMKTLKVI